MGKVTVVIEHPEMSTNALYKEILEDGSISEEVLADYLGMKVRVYIVPSDEG